MLWNNYLIIIIIIISPDIRSRVVHNDLLLYGECESKFGEDQARFSNGSRSVATWLVPEVCFCKNDSLKLSWEWKFRRVTKAGPCLAGREGSKSKECTPLNCFSFSCICMPMYDSSITKLSLFIYLSSVSPQDGVRLNCWRRQPALLVRYCCSPTSSALAWF